MWVNQCSISQRLWLGLWMSYTTNVWYQPPSYGNCVFNFLQDNSSVPGYRPVEFQPSHNQTKGYTKTGTYSSPKRGKKKQPTSKKLQQDKIAWDTTLNYKYFVAIHFCSIKDRRKESIVYINWYQLYPVPHLNIDLVYGVGVLSILYISSQLIFCFYLIHSLVIHERDYIAS